ncbi:Spo0B domain-containing protein [Pullulanibacillus sp. KACC 23026]|uniref:Spo0B domain-containing protein n=1 Tax=Pullulanibacillus sp. KACC 23026 TaxID=3028315 RepID=UPI0023AF282A|nr:Spo0B domain-containing protein [Pullulanibacillus sp. KACC 23026]WEG14061.1 Spo0B domain-containing protein [Pullulanibacillus sp. KACC 23026]
MINENQLVEVFRATRHDWLNQLQLIKANLALNRLDRIDEIIHQIVEEAQQESNLSNLKAGQLTAFLLLHKSLNNDYPLKIEVEPLTLDLSKEDEAITQSLETLITTIKTLIPSIPILISIYKDDHEVCLSLQLSLGEPLDIGALQQTAASLTMPFDVFQDEEAIYFTMNLHTL